MTRTITVPPMPWFDPETGNPTQPFRSAFEELLAGRSTYSIGTVISGVNAVKQASIEEAAADAENESAPDTVVSDCPFLDQTKASAAQ